MERTKAGPNCRTQAAGRHFPQFVLEHAEALLRGDQAYQLLTYRNRAEFRLLRSRLAVAAGRLLPARRYEILASSDDDGETAIEMARWFPERARTLVHEDFYAHSDLRDDILYAVLAAGTPARNLLRDLVLDQQFPGENEALVSQALRAARSVLADNSIECPGLGVEGHGMKKGLQPGRRNALLARAQKGSRTCLVQIREALKRNPTHQAYP